MRKILSIDAGWGGAVAYWVEETKTLGLRLCPGDSLGMINFLNDLVAKYGPGVTWEVYIEANTPSPKFGARGNFGLGMNVGAWETALLSVGMSPNNINPKEWQKLTSNINSRHKKGRKKTKEKAWRYARKNFPSYSEELGEDVPSPRNPKQGLADALCILDWARKEK